MNKLSVITGVLTCLLVLLAALGAVCGTIDQMAAKEDFYGGMSRAAVARYLDVQSDPQADAKVTEYIGLTDEEQDVFAKEMAAFMRGETGMQPEILSEKEQQHMRDVRGLTRAAGQMSKTCMTLAAVLAVVIAWMGAKLKRVLPRVIGALAAVTLIAVCAAGVIHAVSAGQFEALFVRMHEMLFTNDLWLMDPATDILIRMMPQTLFEQALQALTKQALVMFAVVWIMLLAVMASVERMIRRNVLKD